MAVLPYMRQLPQHFYHTHMPAPGVVAAPAAEAPAPPVPATQQLSLGGAWYGAAPPDNPLPGWLWLRSADGVLFTYVEPGIWQQIGTNW